MRPLGTRLTVTSAFGRDSLKAKEQKSILTHNQAIARVWVGSNASSLQDGMGTSWFGSASHHSD